LAFSRALQQRVVFAAKEDYQVLDLQFNFWMFLRGKNKGQRITTDFCNKQEVRANMNFVSRLLIELE